MTQGERGNTADAQFGEHVKAIYLLPDDDLAEDVLIPAFANATNARCMVGYFGGKVLADLAPGLATYVTKRSNPLRLIISPFLTQEDQRAMSDGLRSPEELAIDALMPTFVTTEALEQHTLRCLSWLMATGRLEFRIAILRDALFHPKVWLFEVADGMLAVHGSSNMTHSGVRHNMEQVSVSMAWLDPTQKYVVDKLSATFDRLWSKELLQDEGDDCVVLSVPQAIQKQLLCHYDPAREPSETDYRRLYEQAVKNPDMEPEPTEGFSSSVRQRFEIPLSLRYQDPPYEHQGRAVDAWVQNGYRGTLEMATGAGKTATALICCHRLYEVCERLLLVVAVPYLPLAAQWCSEMKAFGLAPTNLAALRGRTQRHVALEDIRRRLRLGLSRVEVVVVTHDTVCSSDFMEWARRVECTRLLIGDEVHGLGTNSFVGHAPAFFEARLGLSATPVRQYDPEGTAALLEFFGPVVFRFPLEEAIGNCLVEYDYFMHPVPLTSGEMDSWNELTERIRKNAWRSQGGNSDEYLEHLFRERRVILETAQGKIAALSTLLDSSEVRTLRHILIYATDKKPEQLQKVNDLLMTKGVNFHQLTASETADRGKTATLLKAFQDGDIQVLTAKRVLDEGVNIPQVRCAYILASTTVERQWIQRRGRLLRRCAEIGKTHATIHDFIALPPSESAGDPDARTLVKSELRRAMEFASSARNAGRPDGALPVIQSLMDAALL